MQTFEKNRQRARAAEDLHQCISRGSGVSRNLCWNHDNETCQANGDGTSSCICYVPLENGVVQYFGKQTVSWTAKIWKTDQKLNMWYLQRVKEAINSFSSGINSHKESCKRNNNGQSYRQIDAVILLKLIKEDNLCKTKKTLKHSLKGGAEAHGCVSKTKQWAQRTVQSLKNGVINDSVLPYKLHKVKSHILRMLILLFSFVAWCFGILPSSSSLFVQKW